MSETIPRGAHMARQASSFPTPAAMNRICQGRVTKVEQPKPDTKNEWEPLDPDPKLARQKGLAALWNHHALFQDAVNFN